MDIIKHGRYHQNIYRIKCWNCDCIFDCSEYDFHDYCGLGDKVYTECPECNRWNNKNTNLIKK